MADRLGGVISAIRDVPTRRAIHAIGLDLSDVAKSVSTVVRNNEQVVNYALNSINLSAGNGLTGGGDLSASRAFAVGAGFGISVAADAVAVNLAMVPTWTGVHTFSSTLFHTGSQLGFYNIGPVTRPTAYTQTYATADKTIGAYTPDSESGAYTGIDNLQVGTVYATVADLNALRVAYETLRAFTEDVAQALNSVIDDGQALGLLQ